MFVGTSRSEIWNYLFEKLNHTEYNEITGNMFVRKQVKGKRK